MAIIDSVIIKHIFNSSLQRRNFRQVMGDLITGAKLKHVDHTEESIEYELTPYEMLMEEIRARKYELNKVFARCLHCRKLVKSVFLYIVSNHNLHILR